MENVSTSSLQWRRNERHGVSKDRRLDCLLNRLFKRRSRKTSKLPVTGLCAGNSPMAGEFPAQRASNVENVSIWWRHHDVIMYFLLTAQTEICGQLDICFVIDSSGSIRDNQDPNKQDNWLTVLQFVNQIIKDQKIVIGPRKTQVGLVKFSNRAELMFDLDTYDNKIELTNAVLRKSRQTGFRVVVISHFVMTDVWYQGWLILGMRPANGRRRYKVTLSLISWAQT